jgi:hypothetical protein
VQIIHLNINENDGLTEEIKSWKNGFAFALRPEDRELFMEMIEGCNKYTDSIAARGKQFTTESLFIALILKQRKMIKELITQISGEQ